MKDMLEFYVGKRCICALESSHAPDRGDMVNINKITYKVTGRTYTIDYVGERNVHANCIITLDVFEGKTVDVHD